MDYEAIVGKEKLNKAKLYTFLKKDFVTSLEYYHMWCHFWKHCIPTQYFKNTSDTNFPVIWKLMIVVKACLNFWVQILLLLWYHLVWNYCNLFHQSAFLSKQTVDLAHE